MKLKGYCAHTEIAKELEINQTTLKKSLFQNDLNHEPWIKHVIDTAQVYKYKEAYGVNKATELILISSKLKNLIFKEYKRCLGTKLSPNFKSIRKDIEIKDLRIATLKEVKRIKDIAVLVERPSDIKLAMIKSYTDIMIKLGVNKNAVTTHALAALELEIDPFTYANDLNKGNENAKKILYKQIITNKLYELGTEFKDDYEGRRRFCMGITKQTGFDLKYANKNLDSLFNIIEILNIWDIALELCKEEY